MLSLAGLATVLAGWARPESPPPPVELVGLSMPSRSAEVAPEQAGKIVELPVQDGDRVEADAVLFRLNATLEQLEVDRLSALAESDLLERRALRSREFAQKQAERVRDLRDRDISSERDLQERLHELDLAELRLEQAKLDRAQAQNELLQARERLTQRTIRSPFGGIVTRHMKNPGEVVEKFVPVVEVMCLDPLWVEFECPLTEANHFRKGGIVRVAPTTLPDEVREGRILFVSPKATAASHTFMVRAAIHNPRFDWKAGMKMTVESVDDDPAATPSRPGK